MAEVTPSIGLQYDPGAGKAFWESIERLPGYPEAVRRPIGRMLFETGVVERLGEILAEAGAARREPLLVVMDATPMRRGGEPLKPLVIGILSAQGWPVEEVVLTPGASGQVHADLAQVRTVRSRLRRGASVLSVGSGTVTDVAKHACFQFEAETGCRLPFVVFPTANSVSAYTSNMAPLFVEGVKRTLASRYPDAVACDLQTLRDAPAEMTAAGVGDLLAAFVSLPDWRLAHFLGMGEAYTSFPQMLLGPLDGIILAHADRIRERTAEGMDILARLIALGGLIMSLAGTTAPMSGLEHAMSHAIDLLAEGAGLPLAAHGSQVALASILCSAAYQRLIENRRFPNIEPRTWRPDEETARASLAATFAEASLPGEAEEACWPEYRAKLQRWWEGGLSWLEFRRGWPEARRTARRLARPPERLVEILAAVGSPLAFGKLVPPVTEAQVRFAFRSAPYLRNRFSAGDLFLFLGWDRERLWQAIWERSASLGAAETSPGS